MTNSLKDLIIPGRPVTPVEFRAFWSSLSDEEKEYYKNAPLDNKKK